ncbi:MAG: response regulator [Desulfatitalea sp.]|nr:response regulator [Desulfatitalea sp.]NNJ98838.1 response regulator [Desulfatitalea sp.]
MKAKINVEQDFLARMSHEIRTPLNGIIGMTEIALTTRLDDHQKRIIGIIENESQHLLELINNVLDFSKIEADKLDLECVAFDLRHLMDGVGETIAAQAGRKGLEMNLFQSPDIPRQVLGDAMRLRQVLLNLAANAVKFTWEGEINLRADLLSQNATQALIRFCIQDTGIGIAADRQAKIFDRFTQSDASTTRMYGGTGLGTTISKCLVELMGGKLLLESNEGSGTTIWFDLAFEFAPLVAQAQSEHEADGPHEMNHLRVLMVDDCSTSRRFALKYLDVLGCQAQAAENGAEALERLKTSADQGEPFDLVLTDFRMPRMNGYELVRQLRTMDAYEQTPAIVVTGIQEIASGEDFRSLGFDRCIAKPMSFDDLKSAIAEVFSTAAPGVRESVPAPEGGQGRAGCILLAEDYHTNQQVACMHLTSADYAVDVAENGQAAVDLFSRNVYDLVLMDLEMPVMDGFAAARAIRCIEGQRKPDDPLYKASPTPIIALTAHALGNHEQMSRDAGMDDFLTKPLRRKKLLATIQRQLSHLAADNAAHRPYPTVLMQEKPPVMDWDQALSEFMFQEAVLTSVLEGFLETLDSQIKTIGNALRGGDAECARRNAHAINGGAANLCARPLSQAAAELEQAAQNADMTSAALKLAALIKERRQLRAFVDRKQIHQPCAAACRAL